MKTDIKGVEVKIGDFVKGFGKNTYYPNFEISKTPVVEVTEQKGKMFFGAICCESFGNFLITKNLKVCTKY